jgi:hypothetical protein
MTDNHSKTKEIDWRARVVTELTEDSLSPNGEVIHSQGAPVSLTSFAKYDDTEIPYIDPSATALFLNQSYESYRISLEIHPFRNDWPPPSRKPSSVVYDYLESISSSIIYAYTALEVFTNNEIPEDYIYELEKERESGVLFVEHYEKDEIERKFSLSDKLATILPDAYDINTPKGLSVWEGFFHLRRFRHRIIHMKSQDREPSSENRMYPESIWNDLLNPNQQNYPDIAKSMILHFKDENSYHWLKYCPF